MSLLLSTQTGAVVTAAQLLGTEKEEKAAQAKALQKEADKLIRRTRKRQLGQQDGVYEEVDDGGGIVRGKKRLTSG